MCFQITGEKYVRRASSNPTSAVFTFSRRPVRSWMLEYEYVRVGRQRTVLEKGKSTEVFIGSLCCFPAVEDKFR